MRSLPVPHKPILDVIRVFFRHPDDVRFEFSKDTTRTPLLNTSKTGTGRSNPDYRFRADELTTGEAAPVEDPSFDVSPSSVPQPSRGAPVAVTDNVPRATAVPTKTANRGSTSESSGSRQLRLDAGSASTFEARSGRNLH